MIGEEELPKFNLAERIAALICADAQINNYDHGESPTLIDFRKPLGFCPRHLGIAQQFVNDLRDPHH